MAKRLPDGSRKFPPEPNGSRPEEWTDPATLAKFWGKVNRSGGPGACWEWTGYRRTSPRGKPGYAAFWVTGYRYELAHRFAWKSANGEIVGGLFVCHRCDNPICCNPGHLFLGTHIHNVRDKMRKGRHRTGNHKGEAHPNALLTERDVREIRRLGATGEWRHKDLAWQFQVSNGCIGGVIRGLNWSHVTQ